MVYPSQIRGDATGRFVSLEKAAKVKNKLTEYRIPANSKKSLLGILDRHGINRKTLFPDLEGLCSSSQLEVPGTRLRKRPIRKIR